MNTEIMSTARHGGDPSRTMPRTQVHADQVRILGLAFLGASLLAFGAANNVVFAVMALLSGVCLILSGGAAFRLWQDYEARMARDEQVLQGRRTAPRDTD